MIIIGCDYHPAFQQIAFVDTETGEWNERRLEHREGAEKFYRELAAPALSHPNICLPKAGLRSRNLLPLKCARNRL
jgi:hypothetical protein